MKTKNYYGLMAMAIAMMTTGCTQEADEFWTEERGEVVTTLPWAVTSSCLRSRR